MPPLVIGLAGLALLRLGDSRPTGLIGLVTGLWAAPGLLAMGVPLSDSSSYPLGIGISAVAWLLIGFTVSRQSTARPFSAWPQYWRYYTWAAAGILLGVGVALFVVASVHGRALL